MAVKYEEEEKPEVQLTSMMDCIFLMLIFFLVSSQLKKIEKEVDSKGDLYVNSKPVGAAGLRSALQAAAAENPDRRIRIAGDIFAPFRSIVQVLDTCQQEKLTVVGIHTADGLKK